MSAAYFEIYPKLPLYREASIKKLTADPKAVRSLMNMGASLYRIHSEHWDLVRARVELNIPIQRLNSSIRLRISNVSTPYLYDLLLNNEDRGLAVVLFHLGVMNHLNGESWINEIIPIESSIKPQPLVQNSNNNVSDKSGNEDSNSEFTNKINSKLVAVKSGNLISMLADEGYIGDLENTGEIN